MSIILFIAVLAVLILAHEFGHFIVAKKSGMRVDEFGIGFPPRLLKFKKGETLYSINAIPFGGFVKIYGEDGQDKKDPRSFSSKSISIRAAVIAAGVFFNILLAWFVISAGYMIGMPTSVGSAPIGSEIKDKNVVVLDVQKDSPAESAGLKSGDRLVDFDSTEAVQKFISENNGREIEIKYQRGNEILSVKAVPRVNAPEGQGALGIMMDEVGIVALPWHRAIWEGLKTTYKLIVGIAVIIFYFITDAVRGLTGLDQIMGPVGIVTVTGTVAKLGFAYVLNFMAILSINLAIINIIPFPALDGGRLLFLLIEKIKGSPISPKVSSVTHGIGLFILLAIMITITYHDILRLI